MASVFVCLPFSSPGTSWLEKGFSEEVGIGTSIGKLASGLRSPGKEHTPFFSVPSTEDSPGRSSAVCWPCASGVPSITPRASNSESGGLEGQAWGGPQRTDLSLWPRQEAKALSRAGFKQCSGASQPSSCTCPVCVCSYGVPSHCRAPARCQASWKAVERDIHLMDKAEKLLSKLCKRDACRRGKCEA